MSQPQPPGTGRGARRSLTETVRDAERDVCPRCDTVRSPLADEPRARPCRCAVRCDATGCTGSRPEPDRDLRGGWEQADDAPEQAIEYPCPECGFDGPHATHRDEDGDLIAECGDVDCAIEFPLSGS